MRAVVLVAPHGRVSSGSSNASTSIIASFTLLSAMTIRNPTRIQATLSLAMTRNEQRDEGWYIPPGYMTRMARERYDASTFTAFSRVLGVISFIHITFGGPYAVI